MRPLRRTRALQVRTHPRLRRAARKLPPYLPVIAEARAKNRFLKLIRITGTRFSQRKESDKPVRSGNWSTVARWQARLPIVLAARWPKTFLYSNSRSPHSGGSVRLSAPPRSRGSTPKGVRPTGRVRQERFPEHAVFGGLNAPHERRVSAATPPSLLRSRTWPRPGRAPAGGGDVRPSSRHLRYLRF
jgi:hypothetical protein